MVQDSNEFKNLDLTLTNRAGLHARSAAKIVRLVQEYDCLCSFAKGDRRAEGDSILDLLTLGAPKGTTLQVECQGRQADELMGALTELFSRRFDED